MHVLVNVKERNSVGSALFAATALVLICSVSVIAATPLIKVSTGNPFAACVGSFINQVQVQVPAKSLQLRLRRYLVPRHGSK